MDVWTVTCKEVRELLRLGGGRRGTVWRAFFSVGLLGIIWPWLIGSLFITSALPVLLASLNAAMHVSALVPDSIPGERERHTLETLLATRLPDYAILLGKLAAVVGYAIVASMAMLAIGWVTVNLKIHDGLLLYRPRVLISAFVFTVLGAGFMAGLGAVISLRAATVKQAQQVLSTGVVLLMLSPAVLIEVWPSAWSAMVARISGERATGAQTQINVALVLLAAQILLFAVALTRFRREKLLVEHG